MVVGLRVAWGLEVQADDMILPELAPSETETRLRAVGKTPPDSMHVKEVDHYEKKIPAFRTDQAAEEFVAAADLTTYDLSGARPLRFELQKGPRQYAHSGASACSRANARQRAWNSLSEIYSRGAGTRRCKALKAALPNYKPAQISSIGRTKPAIGPSPAMLSGFVMKRGSAVPR